MVEIEEVSRIAKNSTFLTVSTIINNLIGLILAVCIGRYLGKEGFGSYIFAFSFVALFAILTDLGLPDLSTREVARDKERAPKYLGNIILIKSFLAILTYGLIFCVVNLGGFPPSVKVAVYIVALYMIAEYFGKFFNSIFNAFERMEFTAGLTSLLKFFALVGVLTAIKLGYGLKEILWVYVLAGIIYVFICLRLISTKFAKPRYEIDLTFWKDIIRNSFPFALLWLFSIISSQVDITILRFIKGEAAVGLYGAATRMIMAVMFIPANLSTALYPAFSRFYQSAKDSLIKYYQKSFQFLLILALPLAVGTTILAKRFVLLFWGAEYAGSVIALQILIWRIAVIFLASLLAVLLISTDRQKLLTTIIFWVMILNIGLNLILVPHFSYIGASIAALLTGFASFYAPFIYLSKKIYRIDLKSLAIKPVSAVLLMGLFIYLLRDLNLFLLVTLSAVLYLLILFLLKTFTQQDIDLMKQLFRRAIPRR